MGLWKIVLSSQAWGPRPKGALVLIYAGGQLGRSWGGAEEEWKQLGKSGVAGVGEGAAGGVQL